MPDRPAVIIGNPASIFPRHLASLWRSLGLDPVIVTRHWSGERVLPDGTPILASADAESPGQRRAYRALGRLLEAFEARLHSPAEAPLCIRDGARDALQAACQPGHRRRAEHLALHANAPPATGLRTGSVLLRPGGEPVPRLPAPRDAVGRRRVHVCRDDEPRVRAREVRAAARGPGRRGLAAGRQSPAGAIRRAARTTAFRRALGAGPGTVPAGHARREPAHARAIRDSRRRPGDHERAPVLPRVGIGCRARGVRARRERAARRALRAPRGRGHRGAGRGRARETRAGRPLVTIHAVRRRPAARRVLGAHVDRRHLRVAHAGDSTCGRWPPSWRPPAPAGLR